MNWGPKRNRTQWRDGLARTSWQDFERLLARHYQGEGYEVEHCGTGATTSRFDGGVDLVLRRAAETVLVQCKHWNAMQVPHNDVHQLLGLVETRRAQRAILITSGEFTSAAKEAASRSRRIELVDGAALRLMVDPRLIPDQFPGDHQEAAGGSIDASIEVKTGGNWRRQRRQTPEQAMKELGLRLLFAGVLALIGFLVIRSLVQDLQTSLARPAARPTVSQPAAVNTARPVSNSTQKTKAPAASVSAPMTAEQLREWEKKNAEAMEVLEKSTPSVYD